MKILQVATHYADVGGGPRIVHDLCALLSDAGHDVAVLHSVEGQPALRGVRWPVWHVPGMWRGTRQEAARAAAEAVEIAQQRRPDLVLCHGPIDPLVVDALSGRWRAVKVVHAFHDCAAHRRLRIVDDSACRKPLGPGCLVHWYASRCGNARSPRRALAAYREAWRELESLRRAETLLANSQYVRQSLIRNGCRPERIGVLPLFSMMDVPAPAPAAGPPAAPPDGAALNGGADDPAVLFVGRVGYEKGLQYLLRAFVRVRRPARLVVAGDGYHLRACSQLAGDLGIGDRVDFLGWVPADEISVLYDRAAVLAIPSIWPEPFGLVGLEAGCHGCPVVAFDVGALPEWVGTLVAGRTVPSRSVAALGEAIDEYVARPLPRGEVLARFAEAHGERKRSALALIERLASGGGTVDAPGNGAVS